MHFSSPLFPSSFSWCFDGGEGGCQIRKREKKTGVKHATWALLIREQQVLQSSPSARLPPPAMFSPGGGNYSLCDHLWFPTWPFRSVTHSNLFSGTFSFLPDGKSPVLSLQNNEADRSPSPSPSLPSSLFSLSPSPHPTEWLVSLPYPLGFQHRVIAPLHTPHLSACGGLFNFS